MTNRYTSPGRRKAPELGISGWALLIALAVPALMLLSVALLLLVGLLGALPMMLVWNHGLTTFLAATGLGSVAQVGFWQAFWLVTLSFFVGGILHGTRRTSGSKTD